MISGGAGILCSWKYSASWITDCGARRTTIRSRCSRLFRRRGWNSIADAEFLESYGKAVEQLNRARSGTGRWWQERYPALSDISIAYFSAEFGIHQSAPLYAGGLGVLAGDGIEASDLGVPLIGVGVRYSMGYFQQMISAEGNQLEILRAFSCLRSAAGKRLQARRLTMHGNDCTRRWNSPCRRLVDAIGPGEGLPARYGH